MSAGGPMSLDRSVPIGSGAREGGNVLEMQRRRLLIATSELLSEDGLEGAGVGRICKRAGMSRRTFYEIFDDREACFLAALDLAVQRVGRDVVHAYKQDGRWSERVRSALILLLESFDAEPGLARMCLVEALKGSPAVLQYRRWVLERLIGAVDEGRREAKSVPGPVPLTAENTVGGALSILHARVQEPGQAPLIELVSPLMSMIVQPYLGAAAAKRERNRPSPTHNRIPAEHPTENGFVAGPDPFKDLPIRFTYRTARVMGAIATQPGASNRQIADAAGVHDQGQISKLLRRLERHHLIANQGEGQAKGEANAWQLTPRGQTIHTTISG